MVLLSEIVFVGSFTGSGVKHRPRVDNSDKSTSNWSMRRFLSQSIYRRIKECRVCHLKFFVVEFVCFPSDAHISFSLLELHQLGVGMHLSTVRPHRRN